MNKPIPLTVKPDDPDSPKGAVPVDIHGIEGGGGADIDWTDINLPEDAPMMMKYGGVHQFAMMQGEVSFVVQDGLGGLILGSNGVRLSSARDTDIFLNSGGDIAFISGATGNARVTLGEILTRLEAAESRLDALEP